MIVRHAPLGQLRYRGPGYAVSPVKAPAPSRGLPVGPVRALTDPGLDDLTDPAALLDSGLDLVGATR